MDKRFRHVLELVGNLGDSLFVLFL